jgi:Ran GTPase-activating protein (RanGAP) involved in mRNA processing and transport
MQDALKKMREEANIPAVKTVLAIADELALQGWENVNELNLKSSCDLRTCGRTLILFLDRGLGVDEALRLSVVLEKLVNLRVLNLEGNPIGQEGARAIARVIRDHGHLQHIDVEGAWEGAVVPLTNLTVLRWQIVASEKLASAP